MDDDTGGKPATPDAQPQMLATAAVGDTCSNCGARLAGDQRYCVECGQRRGKARYSLPGGPLSASAMGATGTQAAPRGPRPPRLSANGALIGGVATLLLAMAVGLLIGLSVNNSTPARTPSVQYLPSPAASATPTTSTTSTTPSSAATGSTKPSKSKSTKSTKASIAAAAKLPPAAKKIPKKLQSSVAKVGGKCTSGTRGCTNGKFTGQFFGGG